MGRVINLTIYCSRKTGGRYKAYFEERMTGKWYGIKAESLPALSYFERVGLKNSVKSSKNNSGTLLKKISFAPKTESTSKTVRGAFYSGVLKCPDCGNTGYVKCNVCSELTCYDGSGHFICAVCGNSGNVSGHISDLNGNSSNSNNGTGKTFGSQNLSKNSGKKFW